MITTTLTHLGVLHELFYEHSEAFEDELAASLVHHIVREAAYKQGHPRVRRHRDGHQGHEAMAAANLWVNLPASRSSFRSDEKDDTLPLTRGALIPYMVRGLDHLSEEEQCIVGCALMDWSRLVHKERSALLGDLRISLKHIGSSIAATLRSILGTHLESADSELSRTVAHGVLRNANDHLLQEMFPEKK